MASNFRNPEPAESKREPGDQPELACAREVSSPSIRLATMGDLAAIRQLIPLSVLALSRELYSAEQIRSAMVHVFGPDQQLILDQTYFIVEREGQIAGCGGWSKRQKIYGGDQMKSGPDPLLDPAGDAARIRAFFVHPAHARQGIGSLILKASVEAAAAAGFTQLELVGTLPGERLYRRHGFTVAERIDTELPDGVHIEFVRMRSSVAAFREFSGNA